MLELGQIVFSKAGRDKTQPFVIVKTESEYVYLVDGSIRKLDNPKKKKIMHIQITNTVSEDIKHKLTNNEYLLDADFRKALKAYSCAL